MIHEFEVLSLLEVTSGIYFLYDFIGFLHHSFQDWLSWLSYVFIHTQLPKIPQHYFSEADVWIQPCFIDLLLFLGITVFLHDPVSAAFSCWTVVPTFESTIFFINRGVHHQLNDCEVLWTGGCKTSSNQPHHYRWCLVCANMVLCIMVNHFSYVQRTLFQKSCGLLKCSF